MSSFQAPLSLIFLTLATFLLLPVNQTTTAKAKTADAPSPTPATPPKVTVILEKGNQYTTFLRLLKDTEVGPQVASLVDSSTNADGVTILAPTDDAFDSLKPGTLNRLTTQDQSELVLYHVLPKYYSFATFETTSNPVRTQASGEEGVCTVNITSASNQVNVSTGVVETAISKALYSEYPLAVYSTEKVLLPPDLFGPNARKKDSATGKTKSGKPASSTADAPTAEADSTDSGASYNGRGVEWAFSVVVVFIAVVNFL